MTNRCLTILVLSAFGIIACSIQLAAAGDATTNFEPRTYQGPQGQKLPYLLLKPADYRAEAGKRYPLLVFLHGAGERGTDNGLQILHGREFFLAAAKEHGCFVVAPQCPPNARWVEIDWAARSHRMPEKPSVPMGLLLDLLPKVMNEFAIDPQRVYVMGLSMGGYGTWDMIQRRPELFAAAVPICGGGDVTLAPSIARVPVWTFHGGRDGVVPTSRSRDMIEAMRKSGGKPRYTESPEVGHDEWNVAFKEPELAKWLFAQQRQK